ncbi:hypothetical protein [Curtobacterium sp. MCBD17_040]|uniref:hypothetical protein n=1 Tax=Curtobacterium sp. MCBD17_040 TaxID=2175674 RepID=UPI0011B7EFC4|nr:hypothetical protein [Curtobacterium sp. MCBD17_040]WIB65328.1 hypothetical protein DEI94_18145 [Curtobacterium sp. MCBD17_040]
MERETERITDRLASLEAAYDAWKRGETHPDDPYFLAIWKGQAAGVDSDTALDRLNRDSAVLRRLAEGGRVEEIRGWRALGDDEKSVREAIEKRVEMYTEAMRSGGRNLSVNQGHVARMKREQAN